MGNLLSTAAIGVLSPFGMVMGMAWKSEALVNEALSPLSNMKHANRAICKGLLKTTPLTAIPVFGTALAYHKYQQNKANPAPISNE